MDRPNPSSVPFAGPRASSAFERWLLRRGLRAVGNPPITVELWDGHAYTPPGVEPRARMRLADPGVLRELAFRPDPGLADAYVDGRLAVEGDLVRLLELVFPGARTAPLWIRPTQRILGGVLVGRSLRRSRANIRRHYDLGNDFYREWLDDQLVYTCAYFPTPEADLEEAQHAKLEHVARKLALRPGESVVEAGCGWGALALHLAEHHGVRVRAFNISQEQIEYAREQARHRGLADRVEFVLDDYRSIRGHFDAFVSVGMLEHVGKRHYRKLARVIDRCLAPHGRGLVHSIGRARPMHMSPWLLENVFPGAYIPSLGEMMAVFEPADLAVLDVENLRLHYARTLEHWLERFEKAEARVRARFDERFVRLWRLYLASSITAFRTGSCQLYQVVFSRSGNPRIPWTRAGVYAHDGAAS